MFWSAGRRRLCCQVGGGPSKECHPGASTRTGAMEGGKDGPIWTQGQR